MRPPMYVNPDPFIEERNLRLRNDAIIALLTRWIILMLVVFALGFAVALWTSMAQAQVIIKDGMIYGTAPSTAPPPFPGGYIWERYGPLNPLLQSYPVWRSPTFTPNLQNRLEYVPTPNGPSKDAQILPSLQGGGPGGGGGAMIIPPQPALPPVDCYEGEVCP